MWLQVMQTCLYKPRPSFVKFPLNQMPPNVPALQCHLVSAKVQQKGSQSGQGHQSSLTETKVPQLWELVQGAHIARASPESWKDLMHVRDPQLNSRPPLTQALRQLSVFPNLIFIFNQICLNRWFWKMLDEHQHWVAVPPTPSSALWVTAFRFSFFHSVKS